MIDVKVAILTRLSSKSRHFVQILLALELKGSADRSKVYLHTGDYLVE
jgi:hypothetical protein